MVLPGGDLVTESHWNQFSTEQETSTTWQPLISPDQGSREKPAAQGDFQGACSSSVCRISRVPRTLENSL